VVVVVPPLAAREDREDDVVAAPVFGLVVPVAEDVRERVDRPRQVPDDDRAEEDPPDEQREAELEAADREPDGEEEERVRAVDHEHEPRDLLEPHVERILEDVARVALHRRAAPRLGVTEEEPADVRPEEGDERAVRVLLLVGVPVVVAVDGHPLAGRVLEAAEGEEDEEALEPLRRLEAAMSEEPVVAEVDAEVAVDVDADDERDEAGPAEEPREDGEGREEVEQPDRDRVGPVERVPGDPGERGPGLCDSLHGALPTTSPSMPRAGAENERFWARAHGCAQKLQKVRSRDVDPPRPVRPRTG
jgi:hypothetical protein